MVTTINISPQELTLELFEQIKSMFSGYKHIEIEIRSGKDSLHDLNETPEEYKNRILKAIDNFENDETKTFSEDEYKELTENLLKA